MQYVAFSPDVEMLGALPLVMAIPEIKEDVNKMAAEEGLKEISLKNFNSWFNVQKVLNVMKKIERKYGPTTLFTIGKAAFENGAFPLDITTMKEALLSIGTTYPVHHRHGEIGYYKLIEFNEEERKGVMECYNPYPTHFDQGIITGTMRKFRPAGAVIRVELDTTKENRLNGGDRDFFNLTW